MWVRFTAEHWHRFNRQFKTRYPAGSVKNVPSPVGEAAIAAGRAVRMRKPAKAAPVAEVDHDEAAKRR